jgi:hypothetical protein
MVGNHLGKEPGTLFIGMDFVGEKIRPVLKWTMQVNELNSGLAGGFFNGGQHFLIQNLPVDAQAVLKDWNWKADKNLWVRSQGLEIINQMTKIINEIFVVFPIFGFGIVGAELDYDDGGMELHCFPIGALNKIRFISLSQTGGAVGPEVFHDEILPQNLAQLFWITGLIPGI